MNFEDVSWDIFKATGDINSYLLHCEIKNAREKQWTGSKQGQSSQEERITPNQTVC
ncbi:MAG: YqzL family protein [Clostridia bacterium]|nr:YqzL family protein [Clostridia bacterium]